MVQHEVRAMTEKEKKEWENEKKCSRQGYFNFCQIRHAL